MGFGIFAYQYIDTTSNKLVSSTESMQNHAKEGAWKEAADELNTFTSKWEKSNKIWTVLIDHQELDNINLSLIRTKKYLDSKFLPGFLAESSQLKTLIRHIPEKEKFNVENIL